MRIREFFIVQTIILIMVMTLVYEIKEVEEKVKSGTTFKLVNQKYQCGVSLE